VCSDSACFARVNDVANSVSGVKDCATQCSAAEAAYFGLECPRSDAVHCQCSNTLFRSKSENITSCQNAEHHCVGPFTQGNYVMGASGFGSVYLVSLSGTAPASVAITNTTTILSLLDGHINIAAAAQGSVCSTSDSKDCDGSFDGLYAEVRTVKGTKYPDYWLFPASNINADGSGPWMKVDFHRTAVITYTGIFQRPCPCERWDKARFKTEDGSLIDVLLDASAQYALYVLNTTSTSWIKFIPLSANQHGPGAIELEFWTPTSANDNSVCPYNPRLVSNDCTDTWDNFQVQKMHLQGYHYLVWDLNVTSNGIDDLAGIDWMAVTTPTAGWPLSYIGFKKARYYVRATPDGDCRSGGQGDIGSGAHSSWFTYNGMAWIERECVMLKWMACDRGDCVVKKKCKVKDPDTLPATGWFAGDVVYKADAIACMERICEAQCAFS